MGSETFLLRRKPNRTYRLILNLKHLNEFDEYHHFKMDSIYSTAVQHKKQDGFMPSIDLKVHIILSQSPRLTKSI